MKWQAFLTSVVIHNGIEQMITNATQNAQCENISI